jgi:hypothetical protein
VVRQSGGDVDASFYPTWLFSIGCFMALRASSRAVGGEAHRPAAPHANHHGLRRALAWARWPAAVNRSRSSATVRRRRASVAGEASCEIFLRLCFFAEPALVRSSVSASSRSPMSSPCGIAGAPVRARTLDAPGGQRQGHDCGYRVDPPAYRQPAPRELHHSPGTHRSASPRR